MSKNYQYVDTFCKMEQSVNMGGLFCSFPLFPSLLVQVHGPTCWWTVRVPAGRLWAIGARPPRLCPKRGRKTAHQDRQRNGNHSKIGWQTDFHTLSSLSLSLSLPHPIWRLGSLCTSNSTQGVIQLRAKCRRFGDCCWFCSCWCYHVVDDVSKEASRASRFSALKASWFSASGARCRPPRLVWSR